MKRVQGGLYIGHILSKSKKETHTLTWKIKLSKLNKATPTLTRKTKLYKLNKATPKLET